MPGFLSYVCLLIFALVPTVTWPSEDCELSSQSFWELPPNSKQALIGMLVEASPGVYVLGVGDYFFGSHSRLHEILLMRFGVRKLIWSGELLVKNNQTHRSIGQISTSINTSGFVFSKLEVTAKSDNDLHSLRRFVSLYRPDLINASSRHYGYAKKFPHLLIFDRHAVLNDLVSAFLLANPELYKRYGTWQESLRALEEKLPNKTAEKFILFAKALSEYSPAFASKKTALKAASRMEKYLRHEMNGEKDLRQFFHSVQEFESASQEIEGRYEFVILNGG